MLSYWAKLSVVGVVRDSHTVSNFGQRLAHKPAHSGHLGNYPFSCQFVFRSSRFQLFESQGQLVEQP